MPGNLICFVLPNKIAELQNTDKYLVQKTQGRRQKFVQRGPLPFLTFQGADV